MLIADMLHEVTFCHSGNCYKKLLKVSVMNWSVPPGGYIVFFPYNA